jgi:hypothetical protein
MVPRTLSRSLVCSNGTLPPIWSTGEHDLPKPRQHLFRSRADLILK